MKKHSKILSALLLALITGCTGSHLISDKEYLALIEKSFEEKKQLASNRETELFSVFNRDLSGEQTEALKFLFAFMPLSDLADYNGDFFLANIDMSLKAKAATQWGKEIPESIFLHYVLPCRINNENLDSFRIIYYDEIMSRVKGKNIGDAALEINHWCHEKVAYQPADIRTSSPMYTILSARGRCGEESVFTVAALRTAGIPARQVYTPRWAHSDDNHAWVEIWIDGMWSYMGACEPEPVLDRGWFTEPAGRAMLIHTKSFGAYSGSENVVNIKKNYTEVNNLAKYANTKRIFVKVFNKEGLPVKNAKVEFQLYNYAEFYPLAVVPTNDLGISQFETGLGDLLIWASDDDDFNYKKISVNDIDTLILTLDRKHEGNYNFDIDLGVPVAPSPLPAPDNKLVNLNTERIKIENTIRQNYINSWMKPVDAKKLALEISMDSTKILKIMSRSMGNYKEIRSFLTTTPDSLLNLAVSMLEILPDKDLRDTREFILSDHLIKNIKNPTFTGESGDEMYLNYVLNPRIDNEIIIAWRGYFRDNLPSQLLQKAFLNPLLIVQYLNDNISIAESENYYNTPLTPKGVNELKVSDSHSRSICFVAICRSIGIPSRLEPGRNIPQFFFNNIWNDVYFADQKRPEFQKGFIKPTSAETKPVPEYYIHFTIARFENGRYNTLEYDYNRKIIDFKEELPLPPGHYMLVTGNRLNDTKILTNISFFDLFENEHKIVEVKLRKEVSSIKTLGKIDLKQVVTLFDQNKVSISRIGDKGVVIMWIEPDKEPTKHIFNDLPLLKNELESWGGYFLFLTDSRQNDNEFRPESIAGLPANSFFGSDSQFSVLKNSMELLTPSDVVLPYVVKADKNGNIQFISAGYRIGIGEQILKQNE